MYQEIKKMSNVQGNKRSIYFILKVGSYLVNKEKEVKVMTNSELILRLVEMLMKEKEETIKAKNQQNKERNET